MANIVNFNTTPSVQMMGNSESLSESPNSTIISRGYNTGFPTGQPIPGGLMQLGGGTIGVSGNVQHIKGINLNDGITLQMLNTIVNTLINNPDLDLEMNYISPNKLFPGNSSYERRARSSTSKINSNRHNILVRFLISKGIGGNRVRMRQEGSGHQTFKFIPN